MGGRNKRPYLGKKTPNRPKNWQKEDLSRPVSSDLPEKKQTSPDQVGLKKTNAKSDANYGNFDNNFA